MKNRQIIDAIEQFAPKTLAEPWDNPGLMIGSLNDECTGVIVALDLTKDVESKQLKTVAISSSRITRFSLRQ